MVEVNLDELAEATAVVVAKGLRVAERLQNRIRLNTNCPTSNPIRHSLWREISIQLNFQAALAGKR